MINRERFLSLQKSLDHLLKHARRLKGQLVAEQQALLTGDPMQLQNLVGDKKDTLEGLAALDAQFRLALQHAGYLEEMTLVDFLGGELSPKYDSLEALLSECYDTNRENSSLVSVGLRHTQQTINFLMGDGGGNDIYGPAGHTHAPRSGNEIGKA